MTGYVVYDVFTEQPFGGNQLAIIPDARDITDAGMAAIAREFNFSETVFLLPPETPGNSAKMRIFTPGGEVPFAGHPTIGTAVMLADAGLGPDLVLELGVGPLRATAATGHASFVTEVPLARIAEPAPELVARALGTAPDKIKSAPIMASLGLPFTFTELTDREALASLTPDTAAFREGQAVHGAPGLDFAQFAWVDEGDILHGRMFAPLDGVPEDPATGSAAAALGALLADLRSAPVAFTLHQGDDMGRPSRIEVDAKPGRVSIGGHAVRVMQGELVI